MKISAKLNLAVVGLICGFLVSIGFLVWTANNAMHLASISDTAHRAIRETNTVMRFTQDLLVTRRNLEDAYDQYLSQKDTAQAAMERLADHPQWHRLPGTLRDQAQGALNVWNAIGRDFDRAEEGIERILSSDIPELHVINGIMRVSRQFIRIDGVDSHMAADITRVEGTIDRAIASGADFIVETLDRLVDAVLLNAEEIMRQNLLVSLIVTAISIVAGLAYMWLFTRRLSYRIRGLVSVMDQLADRNFTVSGCDAGRDEIGDLNRNMNRVIASTSEFFGAVQTAVAQANHLQNDLSASSEESASALNEITTNIDNIQTRFATLNESISTSAHTIGSIDTGVQTLRDRIESQAESMTGVATSVEQMNANVNSVTQLSQDRKRSADDLLETVRDGAEKVTGTNEVIRSISHDIDDILEIIEIINGVSEQTHLLSMNAAIESAHAGEAGKGFAVVAEEIRKLAESTSENAARIDANLREITEKIRDALQSSDRSAHSFEEIQREMGGFSSAMTEIFQSMEELSSGSGEILSSTSEVTDTTNSVNRDAKEMARRIDEIRVAIDSVSAVSGEVANGVNEIKRGAREILDSMVATTETANENRERMREVQTLLDTFRISGPDSPGEADAGDSSDHDKKAHESAATSSESNDSVRHKGPNGDGGNGEVGITLRSAEAAESDSSLGAASE